MMAVPLLAFGFLGLIYVLLYLYKLLILRYPSGKRHGHLNSVVATNIVIIYVLYIFVTRQTLDIFNCAPTDPPDGNLYMAGRTDIVCGESSVHVNLLMPLASVCIVIYVTAFPVFAFILLRRNKERVKHDQILRAHGEGNDRLINPNYTFRRKFQRLYHLFRPGKWYWILLILLRKFMIAFTSLMFRTSPVYQLAMTLLVVFASYVMQVKHQPYMSNKDFEHEVEEHRKKVLEGDRLHIRIQATIDECKAKNVDKTRASHGWADQQKKLKQQRGYYLVSEKVVQYLTDFNTVEAILLASAILVNLVGIMFLSSRFDGDSKQHYRSDYETLGILCMIVVLVSFLYWVMVFSFEMLATFRPDSALRVVAACSCGGNSVSASSEGNTTKIGKHKDGKSRKNRRSVFDIDMQQNPLAATLGTQNSMTDANNASGEWGMKQLQKQLQDAQMEIAQLKHYLEIKSTDKDTKPQPVELGRQKREFPQFQTFRSSLFHKKKSNKKRTPGSGSENDESK